jgi:hypothetical protein
VNRASLLTRSIIAILLLIGFYVLALGMAAGLLWTVYAQLSIAHRVFPKLALICVVLAGIILWSVLPRPDRFEPPGPELTEHAHPRLFALIRDVADKTRQRMPREVYLIADVNAFVAQRGGMMGFFSRRVMGLGLPQARHPRARGEVARQARLVPYPSSTTPRRRRDAPPPCGRPGPRRPSMMEVVVRRRGRSPE